MSEVEKNNDQTRSSRPAILKQLLLQSEQAQNVFRKSFREVDRHSFSISIISRARRHQQKAIQAEHEISALFAKLDSDLDIHIERLEHVYEKASIDAQGVMSNPYSTRTKVSTRLSMDYLMLIEKLDRFLCLFEPLVILGQISYDQRQTVTFQWQDRMHKVATKVRIMSQDIRAWHKQQVNENVASD